MGNEKRRIPFGMIALQMGFVTEGQIRRALEIQSKETSRGEKHRLIGRILSDLGWITDAEVYQVMGAIHRTGISIPNQIRATA